MLTAMNPAIFVALCGGCVIGLLYAESTEGFQKKLLFKPAASVAFILAGVAAGATNSAFGRAMLAGLVLCAAGDVLLITRRPAAFLAGMAAFAAGHIAYIAAFVIGGIAVTTLSNLVALGAAIYAIGLLAWMWRDFGSFWVPVVAYSIIISLMVAASAAHYAALETRAAGQLFAAATAFALSDFAVARDQFRERSFINRLWGLPLYYAAQCLFAISV